MSILKRSSDPLPLGVMERYIGDKDIYIRVTNLLLCTQPITRDVYYGKVRKLNYILTRNVTASSPIKGLILKMNWYARVPAIDYMFIGPLPQAKPIPGSLAEHAKIEIDRPNYQITAGILEIFREEIKVELDITGAIEATTLELMKVYKTYK